MFGWPQSTCMLFFFSIHSDLPYWNILELHLHLPKDWEIIIESKAFSVPNLEYSTFITPLGDFCRPKRLIMLVKIRKHLSATLPCSPSQLLQVFWTLRGEGELDSGGSFEGWQRCNRLMMSSMIPGLCLASLNGASLPESSLVHVQFNKCNIPTSLQYTSLQYHFNTLPQGNIVHFTSRHNLTAWPTNKLYDAFYGFSYQ